MIDLKSVADRLWDWMTDGLNCTAALDLLYPGRALISLATRVGLSFPGHRIEKIPRGELLDAVGETLGAQPAERKRVLDEMVATIQHHRQDVSGLRPVDVHRWLGVPDEAVGIRRLFAAIAFGSPPVARAAQQWWRESVTDAADDVAADAEGVRDLSVLTAAMERTARPLEEAASVLQEVLTQIRDVTRGLQ